jgi:hypothetical protein
VTVWMWVCVRLGLWQITVQLVKADACTNQKLLGVVPRLGLTIRLAQGHLGWFPEPSNRRAIGVAHCCSVPVSELVSPRAARHGFGAVRLGVLDSGFSNSRVSAHCSPDLNQIDAIPVHAWQTPSELPKGETRVDHYTGHVQDVLGALPLSLREQIACVVGDGYYAKKTFVDGVVRSGQDFVGKLRNAANLKYLFTGTRTGKRGRPKRFAGKVDWQDFSNWVVVSCCEEQSIYASILYSPSLELDIQVVCIVWQGKTLTRHEVLFSTNLKMAACYRARFEMEFPFRDTKQFADLMDCQSRSVKALEFHWNSSFLVVSLARMQQLLEFEGESHEFVFSMENAKRRAYNQLFAERIIALLPAEVNLIKFRKDLQDTLNLGVKTA